MKQVIEAPDFWLNEDIRQRHVVITGSRRWFDEDMLRQQIAWCVGRRATFEHPWTTILRVGDAKGADQMALDWATGKVSREHITPRHHTVWRYTADWDKLGKRAGILRNIEMVDDGPRPHFGIAFKLGMQSRGTDHCVDYMRQKGIPVYVFQRLSDWVPDDKGEPAL